MPNMKDKSLTTKRRGTEVTRFHSKYQSTIDSNLQSEQSASNASCYSSNNQFHDTLQHSYALDKANSISGPHCPTTESKRIVISKISQSNEPELASNMNKKTHKTKLRGNEMSRFHSKSQPITNSELQTKYSASNSSFVPYEPLQNTVHQTYTIDRHNHSKTAGRGMLIKQIAESTGSSNGCLRYPNTPKPCVSSHSSHQFTVRDTGLADEQISEHFENLNLQLKNTILNFSNNYIEQHFKTLQQKKEKEQKEENEKMWGKMLQSNKKKL